MGGPKENQLKPAMTLAEFCRMIEKNPQFHKENHPSERDIVLFVIEPDLLLGRIPDGPVAGRFVATHLDFCQDCKSVAEEVKMRRKKFEESEGRLL